ncbi:hypothetical protein N7516_005205 [Penicillium verrucosum]|uniref:uncharacterized protein n=1 Tax=Penicillium verrucosum TaxID=60171 RepID=UPI002545537A|nr:uncharacterized protein N7516_005205 [Penicillium verrucosum]KAJ5945037.1 hypothetical protein N7516_005205 [Penicillium verrucosum]
MGENTPKLEKVEKYNKLSNSSSPKRTVSLPDEYRTSTLQGLRGYLLKSGHLPKQYHSNPFCKEDGAIVTDDTTFNDYAKMNDDAGGEKDGITEFKLYYKTVKAPSGMDDTSKEFLAKGQDLSVRDQMAFLNPTLNKLESKFKSDSWKASAGKVDTHAADMDERQRGIVMRNNDLLSGKFFGGGDSNDKIATPTRVSRARYTGKKIPEYNITFKSSVTPPEAPEIKFRIPRYQICDSSKVEVFETQSSISASMAGNAFSQTTIEASAGGGAFGVSVGVKAGATTSESSSYDYASAKDEKCMHISYMFPRADIFLEAEDLELTEECHVFVPHVQIGGRLYSVENTKSIAGSSTEEKASALKAAASASVSGFGFQAEVSASHETTENSKVEKSNSSSMHSITPPAWCPTVQSYYNWRVMNQIRMIDIVKLIGQLKGYEDIPRHFERIYYSAVEFKICLWDAAGGADVSPYLSLLNNEHVIESSDGGGGNYSRRAKRHALKKTWGDGEHMKDVSMQISALKDQLVWEGAGYKTAGFKYGVHYPMRFVKRDSNGQRLIYGVRRTTLEERYQKPNYLYGGLYEEPNVLVMFRNVEDDTAAGRADKICSTDQVRMDFYEARTREHIGWLQNDGVIAYIETGWSRNNPSERKFKFYYI